MGDKKIKKGYLSNRKKEAYPLKDKIANSLSNRVGVDLGTATTVVYVDGEGVVLREPTLVAVNRRTGQVVAIGKRARVMIGRTPEYVEVIQPVQGGVICDYEVTAQMFEHIFRKAQDASPKIFGPTVIVGIPCCTSQTEINALRDAAIDAGARQVHIVYEPFAAIVGMGMSLNNESATMVVDVGGGTSDSMILAGGEIVANDSIRVAGDALDISIEEGLKNKKRLSVGLRTTEDLKIAIMQSVERQKSFRVQGRNTANGLPLEVEVTLDEILDFISPCLDQIADQISAFMERVSPEILTDLKNDNIYFVGGGSAIYTFPKKIEESLNLNIVVPENAMTIVARGTAIIARNPNLYKKYFL